MGSGASKKDQKVLLPASTNNTRNDSGEHKTDNGHDPGGDNRTQNPKTEAKRHALNATNKKHVAFKDNIPQDGPMIAIRSDENDNLDVENKSANQMKDESERQTKQRKKEQLIEDQKRRDEEANKLARINNLKEQLKKRMDSARRNYDEVEVDFDTVKDIESDIKHLQKTYDYSTLVDPIERREHLYETYIKVKTRKDQLIMRISELAGARLKHNNPNIADLSDENRASRLFAKFSELYDNEYTDLFEVYCSKLPSNVEEKVAIIHLRDSLKYIYTKCKKAADDQRRRLALLLSMSEDIDPETVAVGLKLRIKEFQKIVAKFTIPSLQSSVHMGIDTVESLNLLIKTIKPKKSGSNPYLRHYLDRCTELCWYTQIQDPPVVVDFTTRANLSDYRTYTKSGPLLDYIVWPVLLLHEGGPILYRGVAQFKGDSNGTSDRDRNGVSDRRLSDRSGKQQNNKREPPPYHHKPFDETHEQPSRVRAVVVETGESSWDD